MRTISELLVTGEDLVCKNQWHGRKHTVRQNAAVTELCEAWMRKAAFLSSSAVWVLLADGGFFCAGYRCHHNNSAVKLPFRQPLRKQLAIVSVCLYNNVYENIQLRLLSRCGDSNVVLKGTPSSANCAQVYLNYSAAAVRKTCAKDWSFNLNTGSNPRDQTGVRKTTFIQRSVATKARDYILSRAHWSLLCPAGKVINPYATDQIRGFWGKGLRRKQTSLFFK